MKDALTQSAAIVKDSPVSPHIVLGASTLGGFGSKYLGFSIVMGDIVMLVGIVSSVFVLVWQYKKGKLERENLRKRNELLSLQIEENLGRRKVSR